MKEESKGTDKYYKLTPQKTQRIGSVQKDKIKRSNSSFKKPNRNELSPLLLVFPCFKKRRAESTVDQGQSIEKIRKRADSRQGNRFPFVKQPTTISSRSSSKIRVGYFETSEKDETFMSGSINRIIKKPGDQITFDSKDSISLGKSTNVLLPHQERY